MKRKSQTRTIEQFKPEKKQYKINRIIIIYYTRMYKI